MKNKQNNPQPVRITSLPTFNRQSWMKECSSPAVQPGSYLLSFEELVMPPGERRIPGRLLLEQAEQIGANACYEHAVWMQENPSVVPRSLLRNRILVFPGTVALTSLDNKRAPGLYGRGDDLCLTWVHLEGGFDRSACLVRLESAS